MSIENANSLLRQYSGSLSDDLLQSRSDFGLGHLPNKLQPDTVTPMVCGFCSTGCGLNVHIRGDKAVNLSPRTEYPVNQGMACPKGWESLSPLASTDRATTPLLRKSNGSLDATDWDTALRMFRDRFQQIGREHGPESVAFLSTGQISTEEMALLGAVAKFGMGIVHGDGNTRQCMATAAVAYKQAFGFDAPPYTYADFEQSDTIVLVGSNLCIAHPIMWQRVQQNRHNPEIIVVDPRRTETAMRATQHVALRPKSDLILLYGIANSLIQGGHIDQTFIDNHTHEFEHFCAHLEAYTIERVAKETGLETAAIEQLAESIASGKRVSFWWTMGVNQSYEGVYTAQAIINLALMTGNIGRPGTGANSITGQCNAMGSRLFSNTTSLLGGRDFASAGDRKQVAKILDMDVSRIPDHSGLAYHEILEGVLRGKIKGLWVIGTNPAHSWINQNTCHEILDRLDFLVVQDMYHTTDTARRADLFLPAAGWGEKEGTFINSERRIGRIKKVSPAPGESLCDFSIFRLIAHYWGCGEMFAGWDSPEAVFAKLKRLSRGQPCDFSGIDGYRSLDESAGIQWPFPENGSDPALERRLFEDGKFFHADGRARFLFGDPRPMPERPSKAYPYLLMTGRGSSSQWHTQTRTGQVSALDKMASSRVYVEINPADARREGIRSSQTVVVQSQRGRVLASAFVTYGVQPGQAFMPMHYAETNKLTLAHFDPQSKQPSYKNCAVRIRSLNSYEVPL